MEKKYFPICVIGSANNDQYLIVPKFPSEGETIQANESFIKNGGKGANQAVSAGRLNAKICFSGQIGKDDGGNLVMKEMQESNVDLTYLRRIKEANTGQAIIMLNPQACNSIIIIGGANTYYPSLTVLHPEYQSAIESS